MQSMQCRFTWFNDPSRCHKMPVCVCSSLEFDVDCVCLVQLRRTFSVESVKKALANKFDTLARFISILSRDGKLLIPSSMIDPTESKRVDNLKFIQRIDDLLVDDDEIDEAIDFDLLIRVDLPVLSPQDQARGEIRLLALRDSSAETRRLVSFCERALQRQILENRCQSLIGWNDSTSGVYFLDGAANDKSGELSKLLVFKPQDEETVQRANVECGHGVWREVIAHDLGELSRVPTCMFALIDRSWFPAQNVETQLLASSVQQENIYKLDARYTKTPRAAMTPRAMMTPSSRFSAPTNVSVFPSSTPVVPMVARSAITSPTNLPQRPQSVLPVVPSTVFGTMQIGNQSSMSISSATTSPSDAMNSGDPEFSSWKFGALQEFIANKQSMEDVGSRYFPTENPRSRFASTPSGCDVEFPYLSPDDALRIAFLDVVLLNRDRHLGNILLVFPDKLPDHMKPPNNAWSHLDCVEDSFPSDAQYIGIPIDHGLLLCKVFSGFPLI